MSIIKSISGIRGTIGGQPGLNLTPVDIVKFTSAFGTWIKQQAGNKEVVKMVVGRDARLSGEMVNSLVVGTLTSLGINVVDLGLATTPTTEMAVTAENADGGVIITASHNPMQWNALKLLNSKGEFLSDADGKQVLSMADSNDFTFAQVNDLGCVDNIDYTDYHINAVLNLPLVDVEAIKQCKFKVAVDAVNSVGGIVIPRLLSALGVEDIVSINCNPDGNFAHNPEPIPAHLTEIASVVKSSQCDVGFVVDPDVDRLAIISEDGTMFGEEYTLVAIADYVLEHKIGNTVSNLSSSRALRDVTLSKGGNYYAAAVGEVNVVEAMKVHNAVIGGEGNGGVIYPEIHYGRDALVGVALFLTLMAKKGQKPTELRQNYPSYFMSKQRIDLSPEIDPAVVLDCMKAKYSSENITDIDGVKIDFENQWVHLRRSNTEPIIRVYTESVSQQAADNLAYRFVDEIQKLFVK